MEMYKLKINTILYDNQIITVQRQRGKV